MLYVLELTGKSCWPRVINRARNFFRDMFVIHCLDNCDAKIVKVPARKIDLDEVFLEIEFTGKWKLGAETRVQIMGDSNIVIC